MTDLQLSGPGFGGSRGRRLYGPVDFICFRLVGKVESDA